MQLIDGAGLYGRPEQPFATHWVEQFRVPDLSVGTYSIPAGGIDDQMPHTEDEIYVVTSGRAMFDAGSRRVAVAPGSVIFVAAGEEHKFVDVTEDLATIVLFAPAEGSRHVPWYAAFIDDYIAEFNEAVALRDFTNVLRRFTDDAVIRFENVPPDGGTLEFAGRQAYTSAYADRPPDDQLELTGTPTDEGGALVAAFAWRRDNSPGVMRLMVSDGLISRMVVSFG